MVESDLSVLMVDAQLSRDGTPLTLTDIAMASWHDFHLHHLASGVGVSTI